MKLLDTDQQLNLMNFLLELSEATTIRPEDASYMKAWAEQLRPKRTGRKKSDGVSVEATSDCEVTGPFPEE